MAPSHRDRRESETSAAYQAGILEGLKRVQPFTGRSYVVDFPEGQDAHGRVIAYEQTLLRALSDRHSSLHQAVERERYCQDRVAQHEELFHRHLAADMPRSLTALISRVVEGRQIRSALREGRGNFERATDRLRLAYEDLEWAYGELTRVRQWLDNFVDAARNYSEQRPKLRRTPEPEAAPSNVRIFQSPANFMADNPERADDA